MFLLSLLLIGLAHAGDCALDADGDGYAGSTLAPDGDGACESAGERPPEAVGEDCDDADPDVHPGAPEVVGDLVDDDCDGVVTCFADLDLDGWRTENADPGWYPDLDCEDVGEALATQPTLDCNDGNADTWPGAPEIVGNDFDEDCDGLETCYPDADEDGFRTDEPVVSDDGDCDDPGEAHPDLKAGDCDDTDANIQDDCPPAGSALTGSGCTSTGGRAALQVATAFSFVLATRRRRPC
ncbi:hypothetical protein LBMAG42_21060 [Deltaproteobacteria bacterium]|nr:hypothetical protein LBMAG42_21060 [Deltaproteobacteria bacterium]